MNEKIINRVAENKNLLTFNLEDYYTEGQRVEVDLSQWLDQGFILREKDFRTALEKHNWSQYAASYIAVHCSTDAIVPAWAYMLFTVKASPFAKKIVVGTLDTLETILYEQALKQVDYSEYQNKFVIIKGCSNKPVPQNAYINCASKLMQVAKSVMYGEACSAVPLHKKQKS